MVGALLVGMEWPRMKILKALSFLHIRGANIAQNCTYSLNLCNLN